jgi:hypothetical protein
MRISDYFLHRAVEIASHGRKMTFTVAHKIVTIVVECPDNQGCSTTKIFEEKKLSPSKLEG